MPVQQARQVIVDDVREAGGRVQERLFERLAAARQRQAAVLVGGIDRQNEGLIGRAGRPC